MLFVLLFNNEENSIFILICYSNIVFYCILSSPFEQTSVGQGEGEVVSPPARLGVRTCHCGGGDARQSVESGKHS